MKPASVIEISVSQSEEGQYRSINHAIRAAPVGARILVKPGHYIESVVITKPVEIIGDGRVSEIVVEGFNANALKMDTDFAIVRNMTFRNRAYMSYAVSIPQGQLVLEYCDVSSRSLSCIGVYGKDTHPSIRHCIIHHGKEAGIAIHGGARGLIEDCELFEHRYSGIEIKGASPTLRNCFIHDCRENGILLFKRGSGIIEDCQIVHNGRMGIEIGDGSNPTISRCHVNRNGSEAVWVYGSSSTVIQECDLSGNRMGVWKVSGESSVTKIGNRE